MNSLTKEELVKIIQIDNQEWLFFPRFHIDVALVRGTTADTKGNITKQVTFSGKYSQKKI